MPDWKQPLASRLASLRLSPTREREILEELSQHLDDVYRERRLAGASHEDALRGALDEIDERELLAGELGRLRQARRLPPPPPPGAAGTHWFRDVVQDVAYGTRTLLHARGWTLVVVLLLALGIGANTALFTATDTLLFSAVPVEEPETLVRLRWTGKNDAVNDRSEYGFNRPLPDGARVGSSFSYPVFQELARSAAGMADLFAGAPVAQLTVVADTQAEVASGFAATGNYFQVLGIHARAGRLFTPDDDAAGATPVVVISSRYWRSRFGGDPAVVGRVIRANDLPVTIIGVAPAGFSGVQRTLDEPPDIWFPLSLDAQMKASTGRAADSALARPTTWWLQVMGRLQPGATPAQVQAKLDAVFQHTARAGLQGYLESLTEQQRSTSANRNRRDVPHLLVDSARRGLYDVDDRARTSATILNAVVIVLLLIICANVANLVLARAMTRRKEISVRLSLGATRGRLLRQLFTEALVLAAAGAACGVLVAYYGVRLLPEPASAVDIFRGRTLLFTALAAVLTSLVFGALPALRATRVDVNTGLKETARSISGRRSVLARTMLVLQVALSLVLIVGAGLFLQTVEHLRRVDVGFDPDNLLLVRITPRLAGYDLPRTTALYGTLLERFAAVPGVRGATLSQPALLSGNISSTDIYVDGAAAPAGDTAAGGNEIYYLTVAPTFFDVMGMPIVRGRPLLDSDNRSAPRVAVINETAARQFFGTADPIGRRFGSEPDRTAETEVIGVVRDARYANLREPVPPTMYMTYLQAPRSAVVFELRTATDPLALSSAVREAVRQVDPNLPLTEITTQRQRIEERLAQEKLFAQAYALFGGIALLLASIGLFGLMSYNVTRRTAEMGLRMALGAQRRHVIEMVMRESLTLVAAGVITGIAIATFAGRLIRSLLFNMPPHHVPTLLAAVAVMGMVSALAAYLPARRASRVDPVVALRQE
ncbi:MAG TPA: ABC transporter permease [Vicinamibacterales bacterium]|nr:ABC transporter permease [Vicinamibacterales bacterium]